MGLLSPLLKGFLEELAGELDVQLEEEVKPQERRGNKLLKTTIGNLEIEMSWDRNWTLEFEIVPNLQCGSGVDLDRQILALYARGASYEDFIDTFQ